MSHEAPHRLATAGVVVGSLLLLGLLVLPVGALVLRGGAAGVRQLGTDAELRASLSLTVLTATAATLATVALGTPLAWLLARERLPGGIVVSALLELPLLIPHPVAGIALLLAFGRSSVVGGALERAGLALIGSPYAIALAMLFVAAPLYVSAAREAIARVDERYEAVARTLGDSTWRAAWRITRPMAGRGLVAAGVVMWARAVSEFGAIVILTYNPKVASVLSYDRFNAFGLDAALPVAAVLVLLALVPLLALRSLRARPALGEPAR
ncbi:MAG TPA: ABC transporter permease [Gemmatimonadaceae bacterium]|nr:ABC transporter permease [Gemmatimonadaceae bacterium]